MAPRLSGGVNPGTRAVGRPWHLYLQFVPRCSGCMHVRAHNRAACQHLHVGMRLFFGAPPPPAGGCGERSAASLMV